MAAALAVVARVCYILYNGDRDLEGDFMGFRWMSSFLYSFGVEVAFITVGMVINYSTNFMEDSAARIFRHFGWTVQAVGFYFIFWIFIDESTFTDNVEIAFSVCFAITAIYIQSIIRKFVVGYVRKLKRIIRKLNDVIVLKIPSHVNDIEVYYDEVMWPTLKEIADEI